MLTDSSGQTRGAPLTGCREDTEITVSSIRQEHGIVVQSAPAHAAMEQVEHEWTRLWRLHHPGLFHSFAWMRLWMTHFAEEHAVELFTVIEHGVVRMIAPLRFRELGWGPIRVRMAETIGTLHLPCNDFLYDPPTVGRSFAALVRHLARQRRVHLVRLVALPEESALTPILREGFGWRWGVRSVENIGCRNRAAAIDKDFQTYFAGLSASLRTSVSYKLRRLTRAGRVSLRFHRRIDETPDLLEDYFQLYAKSWQKRERREPFFRDALRLLSSLDKLRLFFLELDGRAIAGNLLAVDDGIAYGMKNFFDAEFSQYSPGMVLFADAFRRAIDGDRVKVIDHMKGDEEYKARWASTVRRRFDWTVSLGPTGTGVLGVKRLTRPWAFGSQPHE